MSLPKRPDLGELEKAAGKDIKIDGHTIEDVPPGKYKKIPKIIKYTRYYSTHTGHYPGIAFSQHGSAANLAKMKKAVDAGKYSGPVSAQEVTDSFAVEHEMESYDWQWDDPFGNTREQLAAAETEKARAGEELAQQKGAWKRKGGGKGDSRPGTRSGSTILTGGRGVYGKPATKKEKLGA